VIGQLRDQLPGVEIGADRQALIFMADHPDLAACVRSAAGRVCGDPGWTHHFRSLGNQDAS